MSYLCYATGVESISGNNVFLFVFEKPYLLSGVSADEWRSKTRSFPILVSVHGNEVSIASILTSSGIRLHQRVRDFAGNIGFISEVSKEEFVCDFIDRIVKVSIFNHPEIEILHNTLDRRVVSAAVLMRGGMVISSPRHQDTRMMEILMGLYGDKAKGYIQIQGFVDQVGIFMNRLTAWEVASAAGQILRPEGGPVGTLYSEHLY